ncbi:MAG TPA: hypothetical protein VLH12_08470 [Usitatibacter sp.]|nr:hypothetical protein [Usitatibacter sp.]
MSALFETLPIPLEAQIRSVEREIGLRLSAYPRFVAEHRMTQVKADHEIAAMRAVLRTLQSIKESGSA